MSDNVFDPFTPNPAESTGKEERRPNRFAKCSSPEQLLFQMCGAASACWDNLRGAGAFDSTEARLIGEEGLERLYQLTGDLLSRKCLP